MLTVSSVLGLLAVAQSFALLYIGDAVMELERSELRTMMFLQLVAGGHLMLFVTRTRHSFWTPPHPNPRLFWAIIATQVAAVLMCGFGWLVPQLTWRAVGFVWCYNLAWMVMLDFVKLALYRFVGGEDGGAVPFLRTLKRPLHPSGLPQGPAAR
jgi:H+-transporting ATPase